MTTLQHAGLPRRISHGDMTGRAYNAAVKARAGNRDAIVNSTEAFKQGALEVLMVDCTPYAIPRAVYRAIFEPDDSPVPDEDGVIDYTHLYG